MKLSNVLEASGNLKEFWKS